MSDTRNVKLGVCKVIYDGVDLGYTRGGVEVSVATETYKVEVDQFGKTPINEIIMGRDAKAKVPLAETTLENLVQIMPGATLVDDAGIKKVNVETAIGVDLLTYARPLILRPIAKADTDRSEDFVLVLAATAGALQFAYKLDEERVFNVEFTGYPSSQTKRLFVAGDMMASGLAATFVNATDTVTITSHGMVTGQAVIFNATVAPDIANFAFGKAFFVRVTDANTVELFPTAADALADTNQVLWTTDGSGAEAVPL